MSSDLRELPVIIASVGTYVLAGIAAWLQPVLIDGLRRGLDLSAAMAGSIAGLEVAATGIVSLIIGSSAIGLRLSLREFGMLGCILVATANAVSFAADDLVLLGLARLLAGVGAALAFAAAINVVSTRISKHRIGYVVAAYTLLEGVLVSAASRLSEGTAQRGLFVLMGGTALVLLPCAFLLPDERPRPAAARPTQPGTADWWRSGAARYLVIGTALWATSAGMFWAFSVEFGRTAGLSLRQIGAISSVGLLASALGGIAASACGRLLSHRLLLTSAVVVQSAAMVLLSICAVPAVFAASLVVVCFTTYFCYPLLLGVAADMDPHGSLTVVIASLFYLGGFSGALLGGASIGSLQGHNVLAEVVLITLVPILLALFLAQRRLAGARRNALTPH